MDVLLFAWPLNSGQADNHANVATGKGRAAQQWPHGADRVRELPDWLASSFMRVMEAEAHWRCHEKTPALLCLFKRVQLNTHFDRQRCWLVYHFMQGEA